jgi:O-antigen ligase
VIGHPAEGLRPRAAYVATLVLFALILIGPALYFSIRGGFGVIVVLSVLVSTLLLAVAPRADVANRRASAWFTLAMGAPLLAVALAQAWHASFVPRDLDGPLRFLLVTPVFLALLRVRHDPRQWIGLALAMAPMVALGIILLEPSVAANTYWLNRIHFGNAALAIGFLALLSIDWNGCDRNWVRAAKLAGFAAGAATSVTSQTRGGWLALLLVLAVMILFWNRASWKRRFTLAATTASACAALFILSPTVQHRIELVSSDLAAYANGNPDTSIGVRLQHWRSAAMLIGEQPVFGAGPNGFRSALPRFAEGGLITPHAASFTELHSQPLAYAADYGLVALAALLAVHLVPILLVHRWTRAAERQRRVDAWMVIAWSLIFLGFGATQEIFSLKSTTSLFSFVIAALVSTALRSDWQASTQKSPSR